MSSTGEVVVSWGFPVRPWALRMIDKLRAGGFKLVWFDGDRDAALRYFNQRSSRPEWLFHLQLKSIEQTRIVERLRPLTVEPFTPAREFKSHEDIFLEIDQRLFEAS